MLCFILNCIGPFKTATIHCVCFMSMLNKIQFNQFNQSLLCTYPNHLKQAIKIQIAVGTEGLQRLNTSTLTDEDNKDPTKIYKLFDDQLGIKVNFRIEWS